MADRKRKATKHVALSRAFRIISILARRIPLRADRWFGRGLGKLAWVFRPHERDRARENIALAYPALGPAERDALVRKMFCHLGQSLMELFWLPNLDAGALARTTVCEGFEPVRRLLQEGRPVIAVTGHFGNWEWLAATIALLGFPLSVLQRERHEPVMSRFIASIRSHFGIHVIDRGSNGAARQVFQALRQGDLLAFLIDQNIRAESVKVPFFGVPALTPVGPARLAIRTEAAVVPIFIRRTGATQYVRCLEPIEVRRHDDPIALTARLTAEIEAQIRSAPEQWVWIHDRWRERKRRGSRLPALWPAG